MRCFDDIRNRLPMFRMMLETLIECGERVFRASSFTVSVAPFLLQRVRTWWCVGLIQSLELGVRARVASCGRQAEEYLVCLARTERTLPQKLAGGDAVRQNIESRVGSFISVEANLPNEPESVPPKSGCGE